MWGAHGTFFLEKWGGGGVVKMVNQKSKQKQPEPLIRIENRVLWDILWDCSWEGIRGLRSWGLGREEHPGGGEKSQAAACNFPK